jgi:hypothetical protein
MKIEAFLNKRNSFSELSILSDEISAENISEFAQKPVFTKSMTNKFGA